MIISIKNYVGLNLKELVKNGLFLLGILAAIGPAFAIYYCIKELGGAESFNIKHVSNFYLLHDARCLYAFETELELH